MHLTTCRAGWRWVFQALCATTILGGGSARSVTDTCCWPLEVVGWAWKPELEALLVLVIRTRPSRIASWPSTLKRLVGGKGGLMQQGVREVGFAAQLHDLEDCHSAQACVDRTRGNLTRQGEIRSCQQTVGRPKRHHVRMPCITSRFLSPHVCHIQLLCVKSYTILRSHSNCRRKRSYLTAILPSRPLSRFPCPFQ